MFSTLINGTTIHRARNLRFILGSLFTPFCPLCWCSGGGCGWIRLASFPPLCFISNTHLFLWKTIHPLHCSLAWTSRQRVHRQTLSPWTWDLERNGKKSETRLKWTYSSSDHPQLVSAPLPAISALTSLRLSFYNLNSPYPFNKPLFCLGETMLCLYCLHPKTLPP